jgi:hypothetical protein
MIEDEKLLFRHRATSNQPDWMMPSKAEMSRGG